MEDLFHIGGGPLRPGWTEPFTTSARQKADLQELSVSAVS